MNAQLEVLDAPALQTSTITTSITKVQGEIAAFDKIAAGIAAIELQHPKDLAVDVTTTAGMKQAVAARAAWRDPRIAVEKARKAAKAPVLELGKQIDTFAAGLESTLREGEDNYDKQIKAEESRKEAEKAAKAESERQRVAAHQDCINNDIVSAARGAVGQTSEGIALIVSDIEAIVIDASFEEFQGQAQLAKDDTLDKLREMHAAAVAHEAEQARIKAEQEAEAARIAAERAELARLRAEQGARDREAAAALEVERAAQEAELRKHREAQEAELRAQREAQAKADAEAAAARRAEESRLAAERAELRRQQEELAAAQRAAEEAKHAADMRIRGLAHEMLDALKDAHPRIADDNLRMRIGNLIAKAEGA